MSLDRLHGRNVFGMRNERHEQYIDGRRKARAKGPGGSGCSSRLELKVQ